MSIKNSKRFAEIEYGLQQYFEGSVSPVMAQVKKTLNAKQVKELADYQRSPAGIMAASNPMMVDIGWQTVRTTGEWNSKTTEDYLKMCNVKMQNDKTMQRDFAVLAAEWRNAVVGEIGRAKYDAMSKQIDCDLAYAYIGQRMEDLMINKLVNENMPKSSMEYIMRKAAKQCIWGLTEELMKSPLTKEIEARGEKAYKPSRAERVAGRMAGSAVDAVSLGAFNGWATFAKFVGCDVALGYAMDKAVGSTEQCKEQIMERSISKGVFGSNGNVFEGFRKQANGLEEPGNTLQTINSQLSHKIKLPTKRYKPMAWTTNDKNNNPFPGFTPDTSFLNTNDKRKDPKYKDVPLIVAPGKEDAYLEEKAKHDVAKVKEAERIIAEKEQNTNVSSEEQAAYTSSGNEEQAEQPQQANENGWEGLLANFGLDGFGDITHNLGYILAMLPDMLVGLFTGKTKSLNMDNSMIPLASIVAGMFVKNPIQKMMLIGMGGANLLNKAGHEALERKASEEFVTNGRNGTGQQQVVYRQYADEPLNPRLEKPVLRGCCLIVNIDKVPCTIQLPQTVVDAYQAGALPLNTLANAILAKNEQMQAVAARQYENNREERETVSRARGIQ
jgi:hypothetical protein